MNYRRVLSSLVIGMFTINPMMAHDLDYCGHYDGQKLKLSNYTISRLGNKPLQYEGYNNLEGPVWYNGALYYSNMGNRIDPETGQDLSNQTTIWRWEPDKEPEIWLDDSQAGTNGLALDHRGRLIGARHLDGSIVVIDWQDKSMQPLVESINGKRFNSPNDLTISREGVIYFTDPDWNVPNTVDRETTVKTQSVYRINITGEVSETAATELVPELADKPNGIVLSLDETDLIVGGLRGLWKFDLNHDKLANPKQLLNTPVDGLGKDCAGNIYITTTRNDSRDDISQRIVILDKDYQEVGDIGVPTIQIATNVAFGGHNRKTLYITSLTAPKDGEGKPRICYEGTPCLSASIFSVELNVPGFPY